MKKRIIGIFGAHLLQLGIQVGVGDVTTLLVLVGGFAWRGGLALGRIQLLRWLPSGQLLQLQLLVV